MVKSDDPSKLTFIEIESFPGPKIPERSIIRIDLQEGDCGLTIEHDTESGMLNIYGYYEDHASMGTMSIPVEEFLQRLKLK